MDRLYKKKVYRRPRLESQPAYDLFAPYEDEPKSSVSWLTLPPSGSLDMLLIHVSLGLILLVDMKVSMPVVNRPPRAPTLFSLCP